MCQQTVEALLKAVFIIKKKERPNYIHKLPKLLEITGIKVPTSIDIDPLGFTEEELENADYFDIAAEIQKVQKNLRKIIVF